MEKKNLNENFIKKLKDTKAVVTHFGYNLDNRSSIYVLENGQEKMES